LTEAQNPATRKPLTPALAAISKRRPSFLRKRRIAEAFDDAGLASIAGNLYDCQETESLVCCRACHGHWWTPTRCRLRVCPLCAYDKAQQRARFVQGMIGQMQYPKLLTLTIDRWRESPQAGIKHLRACLNKLRRSKLFRAVAGGAYNIELIEKEDGWHIHVHLIMSCPYLPYQRLFSAWKNITGQRFVSVDIRAAKSKRQQSYAVKYACKTATYDQDPAAIVRWYNATLGCRLFATFGKWYNATLEDVLPDANDRPKKPPCPHCGAEGASFFARDGPFIFGPHLWPSLIGAFQGDNPACRPAEDVRDILAHPGTYAAPDPTQPKTPAHKGP